MKGKYIYYYLQSVFFQIQFQSLLTGLIGGVSANKFKNISIPVPPLSEQERIVSLLDLEFAKIDAIKANAEKQLQDAKDLFQSALKDLLTPKEGWESVKLNDIVGRAMNIRWKDISRDKYFHYIDLTSVSRETKRIESSQIISFSNAPSRAKQILKKGDLLFATTRPTLKRYCLITSEYEGQICSTGFCVLRPTEKIISNFLFYIFSKDDFYRYIEPLQTGASYPAVTDDIVRGYILLLPSIKEQEHIVNKLDAFYEKIKELQSNYEQTIILCNDLKQSILKDIFG